MLAVMIITTVTLFYGVFILINTSKSTNTDMTKGFTEFVTDMFGGGK